MSNSAGVFAKAADHDANEERHYLYEGKRLNVTWSVLWLVWGIGANFSLDPGDPREAWSAWITVGPLTFEVYATAGGGDRG